MYQCRYYHFIFERDVEYGPRFDNLVDAQSFVLACKAQYWKVEWELSSVFGGVEHPGAWQDFQDWAKRNLD